MNINIVVYNDKMDIIGQLDCDDNSMEVTYQLADIKEPEKRKSNIVRNFTLPGTKNNNQIFNGIFENGYVVGKYNPNLRLIADVIVENNQTFRGNLQLNRINKVNNKLIGYEVTIWGSLADMFGAIGDTSLKSLDFSEYNHIFSADNIMATWFTGENLSGTYPLTKENPSGSFAQMNLQNYIWKNGSKSINPYLGDGYVYPLYYQGQTTPEYAVTTNDWHPSLYTYTIMKKIFNNFGFKWRSSFLESDYFKRMICPKTDDLLVTEDVVASNEFRVDLGVRVSQPSWYLAKALSSSVAGTFLSNKIIFNNDTVSPAKDPGNLYNTSTGLFTVAKNGRFNLSSRLSLRCVYTGRTTGGSTVPLFNIVGGFITGRAYIKNTAGVVLASKDFTFSHTTNVVPAGYTIAYDVLVDFVGDLSAGEQYYVDLDVTIPSSNYAAKTINTSGQAFASIIEVYVASPVGQDNNSTFYGTLVDKSVSDGDFININDAIPNMSVKDFITSVNRLFNLYWVPIGEREFIIEPRDDIYGSFNRVVDWTDLVNNGEVVSIDPLYDITANSYNLTYKGDTDYYNDDYESSWSTIYGSKNIKLENDFSVETLDIETGFSASPLLKVSGTDMVATSFVSRDGSKFKRINPKPRILYYGGVKTRNVSTFTIPNIYKPSRMPKYVAKNWLTGKSIYPYAGHIDDPYTPTQDLNYSICKDYYFNWDNITTNNLYNKYWKNAILEATDKDSHLLTAKVVIPNVEMLNFDLRWIIQVDNVYYRINKLTWSPVSFMGEVELIRAKNIKPYTPKTLSATGAVWNGTETTINSGIFSKQIESLSFTSVFRSPMILTNELESRRFSEFEGTYQFTNINDANKSAITSNFKSPSFEILPTQTYFETDTKSSNKYSIQAGHQVQGDSNYIDPTAKSIIVIGDRNNVSSSTKNISIQGNNNRVVSGIENVNIVGDNIVVNESNVSYINGLKIRGGSVLREVKMVKSPINSSGVGGGVLNGGINATINSNGLTNKGVILGGTN